MRRLLVSAILVGLGCDPAPRAVTEAAAGNRKPGAFDGEVRFADGLVLRDVAFSPDRPGPGETVTVTWSAGEGEGRLRLALVPPRAAARQEVRYGDAAPAAPDPRTVWTEAPASAGRAEITLPDPWHPATVVVWGQGTAPAVEGPRTHDGKAVLGVLSVAGRPTRVVAARGEGIVLDGALDESAWEGESHDLVTSVDGEPYTGEPTRVRIRWDDENLYVGGELPDTDVWGTHTRRDDPLWKEEAFEVFVAADGSGARYLELQVSPRNVVFDARFPAYRKGDTAWNSDLRSAVSVDGTVDRRDDRDRGWTAELAVPWSNICAETDMACPPRAGLRFRMNVFRFDRPARGAPVALALSPTREPDFHQWRNAAEVELGS